MYSRIRELRKELGLSQEKMAQRLGMSQTGYSKYETGENDVLTALAEIFQTSVDYLLDLTDISRPYPRGEGRHSHGKD